MKNFSLVSFKKVRGIIPLLLVSTAGAGLTGCTDREFAVGLGAIAIGAGAIAIGSAASSHEDRGGWDHRGWDHRGGHWGRGYKGAEASVAESFDSTLKGVDSTSALVTPNNWSKTFNISMEASYRLISAFEAAKKEDLQSLLYLGFSHDDLETIAQYSMPSEQGIETVAKKLGEDKVAIRQMVQKLIDIALEQKNVIDSHIDNIHGA